MSLPETLPADLNSLSNKQLRQLAIKLGVDVEPNDNKEAIVARLQTPVETAVAKGELKQEPHNDLSRDGQDRGGPFTGDASDKNEGDEGEDSDADGNDPDGEDSGEQDPDLDDGQAEGNAEGQTRPIPGKGGASLEDAKGSSGEQDPNLAAKSGPTPDEAEAIAEDEAQSQQKGTSEDEVKYRHIADLLDRNRKVDGYTYVRTAKVRGNTTIKKATSLTKRDPATGDELTLVILKDRYLPNADDAV